MYTANLSVSETQVYSYLSLESTSGSSDLQGKMSGTVYLTLGTASTTATIYKVGSSVTEYSKYDNYGSITRAYCEYYGDGTYLTSLTRYA